MIVDTDLRFQDYCEFNHMKNPFVEWRTRHIKMDSVMMDGKRVPCQIVYTEDRPEEWKAKRNEYLRLMHTFRLWDMHFWMEDWDRFQSYGNEYVDMSIYMPCDLADRQCSMACRYFGEKCPRIKEEIKTPESLGFEGRWEYHDKYEC